MLMNLPIGGFEWMDPSTFSETLIRNMNTEEDEGYFFDVDLHYDHTLHDQHDDFPLAPTKEKINPRNLSNQQRRLVTVHGTPTSKKIDTKISSHEKLLTTLEHKSHYHVHFKELVIVRVSFLTFTLTF